MIDHELSHIQSELLHAKFEFLKAVEDMDKTSRDIEYYKFQKDHYTELVNLHNEYLKCLTYEQLQQACMDINELQNILNGIKLLERIKRDKRWTSIECMNEVHFHENSLAKLKKRRSRAKFTN